MNSRLIKFLDRILSSWIILLTGTMSAIVIISVILRYAFSISFIWSEELVTMLFISFSFLGCICAVKEKEHIGIDFIIQSFPSKVVKVFRIIASIVTIIVLAVIIKASIGWILIAGDTESPGMKIPFGIFYSVIPLSFALMILYELVSVIDIIFHGEKGVEG